MCVICLKSSSSLSLSLSGQCQHFLCSSCKGAAEAAVMCDASLFVTELQACSGLRGQGEWRCHT